MYTIFFYRIFSVFRFSSSLLVLKYLIWKKTPVFHLIKSLTVNFMYLTVVAVVVIVIRSRINCKVINCRHARLTVLGGSRIAGNQ